MKVRYGNGWYFFFIAAAASLIAALYFLLKKLRPERRKAVLVCIAFANLAFHFLKYFGEPYYGTVKGLRELLFITLCSSTIAFTPFAWLSRSAAWKDYVFYTGVLGGLAALFVPTEPLAAEHAFSFLSVRFYAQHTMLLAVPLLGVLLGLHRPDCRCIWKMPFITFFAFGFVMVNQALGYELGLIHGFGDFFHVRYFNPSFVWGPSDPLAEPLKIFTPAFMKRVPAGEHAGEAKYWPLLWLTVPVFAIMTVLPFLACLLLDRQNLLSHLRTAADRVRALFERKKPETVAPEESEPETADVPADENADEKPAAETAGEEADIP